MGTGIFRQPWVLAEHHLPDERGSGSTGVLSPVREPAGHVDVVWFHVAAEDLLRHLLRASHVATAAGGVP